MRRVAKAIIDLDTLKHNFQRVKHYAPNSKIMAVIKADAYGHGMIQAAQALDAADAYAVAQLSEAIALRDAGISKPVTVFQGFQTADQLAQMRSLQLRPVVYQAAQVELIEQQDEGDLAVWLKVDTGMGRIGVPVEAATELWHRLKQSRSVTQLGLSSHFANADVPDHESNQKQIDTFNQLAQTLQAETSLANSAGLISFPQAQGDWVRPGIMLYGSSPIAGKTAAELGLKPVMQFQSELIAINHLKKGDCVGYGSLWQCPEDMTVGVVAAGYADGYPRHAQSAPASVNGQPTQIIGRVSMDMISLDLRNVKNPKIGDEVELWGRQVDVDRVAQCSETIAYELLCNASKSRCD